MNSGQPSAADFERVLTVAIVDDDAQIRQALGAWLAYHGMRAAYHGSGESLLQALAQKIGLKESGGGQAGQLTLAAGGGCPVVCRLAGAVLDLNLPGMSGFELGAALRLLDPGLPLVMITALRDEEAVLHGSAPPGVRCLKKPFDLDVLEELLLPQLREAMRLEKDL